MYRSLPLKNAIKDVSTEDVVQGWDVVQGMYYSEILQDPERGGGGGVRLVRSPLLSYTLYYYETKKTLMAIIPVLPRIFTPSVCYTFYTPSMESAHLTRNVLR